MNSNQYVAKLTWLASSLAIVGCRSVRMEMQGPSMAPTIGSHDLIDVDMEAYHDTRPMRWDMVVFHRPQEPKRPLVLRVVGLPGETIAVNDCLITIDGKEIDIPPTLNDIAWTRFESNPLGIDHGQTYHVESNCYYLLGDAFSAYDSRLFGAVPVQNIQGKVLGVAVRRADRDNRWDMHSEIWRNVLTPFTRFWLLR